MASTKPGSSPRTWGTPQGGGRGRGRLRFIPTHVGNTTALALCCVVWSVHPHARGEHGYDAARLEIASGSSPRTWGTHQSALVGKIDDRFIPTHVGNTLERFHVPDAARGSSPRTWGTRVKAFEALFPYRFIPTHVGNTASRPAPVTRTTVHPHARGEHRCGATRKTCSCGSSPRTWGTRMTATPDSQLSRFIPTHVGNTYPDRAGRCIRPVHPHARGEHAGGAA